MVSLRVYFLLVVGLGHLACVVVVSTTSAIDYLGKTGLPNDLFCVERDVKFCSLTH